MPAHDPVAAVYAQALIGASGRDLPAVEEAFGALVDAWKALPGFRALMTAPGINDRDKLGVVRKSFGDAPAPFLNFVGVLLAKGRVQALPAIHEAFRDLRDLAAGRVRAEVASAAPLSGALSDRVRSELQGKLGREVQLEPRVHPDLLGGVRIRIGDWVADGTLKRRLSDLSRRVHSAPLPAQAWTS